MAPDTSRPTDSALLGATLVEGGCRFGLWAPRATRVELALVAADRTQRNVDMTPGDDGVWLVTVPDVTAGQRYGFRVHGDWAPDRGMRFNPAKLLVDPYARAITAGVDYSGPIRDHTAESNFQPDPRDSSQSVPLSVVVADSPRPTKLAKRIPLDEAVIYELHVRGYTRQHPAVPEHLRGTFAGLAYPAVIEHLLATGVNTVELLPSQHFVSEPFVIGRGLTNYWGYNTLGFFAPHAAYSSTGSLGEQVVEFKEMVSKFHEAGIQVIMDVVYNHSAEGGHEGPTLSFRGIDHAAYYRLTQDLRNDYSVDGCGNSIDTSHPAVLGMVLDSMRYWVEEMGVDGFRFDLATTLVRDDKHRVTHDHPFKHAVASDPAFRGVTMIAEPWDIGPFGYQVGAWGPGWSEWNDKFRDHARDFWRGATNGVQELATRLAGSADLFRTPGRQTTASINFVTAHDGFTLRDVVTYDMKHNEANLERNRDGSDDNRSWNHGWEGETTDPEIIALRHRQVKNFMLTQIFAAGVPMITAGDEMGRTQGGNNNAYCQDSPVSWVHWEELENWRDVHEVTSAALKLRADHPVLRRPDFQNHEPVIDHLGQPTGRIALTWLNEFGGEMGDGDWHDPGRSTLGMYLSDADEAFLIWYHGGEDPIRVTMPHHQWGEGFEPLISSWGDVHEDDVVLPAGDWMDMPGRSVCVMRVHLDPLD